MQQQYAGAVKVGVVDCTLEASVCANDKQKIEAYPTIRLCLHAPPGCLLATGDAAADSFFVGISPARWSAAATVSAMGGAWPTTTATTARSARCSSGCRSS